MPTRRNNPPPIDKEALHNTARVVAEEMLRAEREAIEAEGNGEIPPQTGPDDDASPIPFIEARELAPFPLHTLPRAVAEFVERYAETFEVPIDLMGVLAIGAVAAISSRFAKVRVNHHWSEFLNLYTAVAMEPGENKSVAFSKTMGPLWAFEKHLREVWTREQERIEQKNAAIEQGKSERKGKRGKGNDDDEGEEKPEKPFPYPQMFCDDATAETVARILSRQGENTIIASDEATTFRIISGIYSKGEPNNGIFLKGHGGDRYTVNRVDDARFVQIEHPVITMILAVQPSTVQDLGSRPELRGNGLVARFLYVLPESRAGRRTWDAPPVDPIVDDAWRDLIAGLCGAIVTDDSSDKTLLASYFMPQAKRELSFSWPAQQRLRRFILEIEPQLQAGAAMSDIRDWSNKLRGVVARLSGLLALIDGVIGRYSPFQSEIDVPTVERAIELGRYFLSHARHVFEKFEADPREGNGRILADWLMSKGRTETTARDIARNCKRLKNKAPREEAISILLERGWLMRAPAGLSTFIVRLPKSSRAA